MKVMSVKVLLAMVLVLVSSPVAFSFFDCICDLNQEVASSAQDSEEVLVEVANYPWESIGEAYASPLYYKEGRKEVRTNLAKVR